VCTEPRHRTRDADHRTARTEDVYGHEPGRAESRLWNDSVWIYPAHIPSRYGQWKIRAALFCGGRPSAWTPDGSALLLVRPMFRPQRIALLPIAAPKPVDILQSAKYSLMDPGLSPDGHWVAFTTKEGAAFVAPFRGGQPIPEAEWIRVGSPSQQVLNVFWSGDRSRIYSLSKDGQPGSAINSQNFDATRGPTGPPEEVYRLDWPPASEGSQITRIAAAGTRILVPTGRVQSDLWTAELSKRR